MAGRIRTIKPELLENSRTAGLSSDAFRLYVGLILQADDYGNFYAHPGRLQAAVFWGHAPACPIAEILAEVSRVDPETPAKPPLVLLYRVAGEQYGSLTGWREHQKVDKPGKPRVPGPERADAPKSAPDGHSREPRESSRDSRENLAPDLRSGSPISELSPPAREAPPPAAPPPGPAPAPRPPQPRTCDADKFQRAWLKHTGAFTASGLTGIMRLVEEAALAQSPPAHPDEYAEKCIKTYVEWATKGCRPGRQPDLAPHKFEHHWVRIQRLVAGLERVVTPEEADRAERSDKAPPAPRPPQDTTGDVHRELAEAIRKQSRGQT